MNCARNSRAMYRAVKKQWTLLCYALSFFSRIPVSSSINFGAFPFYLGNAYLPVIGVFYALISFIAYFVSCSLFEPTISVILMLIAGLLFTGAFHEDGFADVCDGFGGGYNKQQRLKIMKDSQIGTYGSLGLIILIMLKVSILVKLSSQSHWFFLGALITAAVLSRFSALCLMQFSEYARDDESSKSSLSSHRLPTGYLLFSFLFTFLSIVWMPFFWGLIMTVLIGISTLLCKWYFDKKIEGYSGDCLGFLQQLNELLILLTLVALLK